VTLPPRKPHFEAKPRNPASVRSVFANSWNKPVSPKTSPARRQAFGENVRITAKDRREILFGLLDRGFGRPATLELEDTQPQPLIVFNIPRRPDEIADARARGLVVENFIETEPRE
jgi:hypothetical protein